MYTHNYFSLGMRHDWQRYRGYNCSPRNFVLMGGKWGYPHWSNCSAKALQDLLRYCIPTCACTDMLYNYLYTYSSDQSRCLEDVPNQSNYAIKTNILPGLKFNSTIQCQLVYGNKSRTCGITVGICIKVHSF